MKKAILVFILFLSPFLWRGAGGKVSAQNQGQTEIDSLQVQLSKAKEDTAKVKILNRMSEQSCWSGDYDTALQYANSALALAKKHRFQKGEIKAYNNIGLIHTSQGNFDEALKNYTTSLKISQKSGDKQGEANTYLYFG